MLFLSLRKSELSIAPMVVFAAFDSLNGGKGSALILTGKESSKAGSFTALKAVPNGPFKQRPHFEDGSRLKLVNFSLGIGEHRIVINGRHLFTVLGGS